jgi:hypothetical protein
VPPHAFAVSKDRLDYAAAERAGGGLRLRDYRSAELPAGSFADGLLGGPLKDPDAFRAGLAGFVAGLDAPVRAASLVVPDAWLRMTFTDGGDLPAAGSARDDVLRWKLKRLVPFRVEDLRIRGEEVAPLNGEGPRRLLLAFALELLLTQLEEAFAAAGVTLGQIATGGLSLLGALRPPAGGAPHGLVVVADGGYTVLFGRGEEPLLHRHKAAGGNLAPDTRRAMVGRDLRLTKSFLAEQLGGPPPERMVLAAPPDLASTWLGWLAEDLDQDVELLTPEHLPPVAGLDELPLHEVAPLVGALSREVA